LLIKSKYGRNMDFTGSKKVERVNKRKKVIDLINKQLCLFINKLFEFCPQVIHILGITYVNSIFPHTKLSGLSTKCLPDID
jgi:hypothetical protein